MKKFGIYFLSLICALGMLVFSACSEKEYSIKFAQSYIELSIGENVDLQQIAVLENVDFYDLTLSSLDSSVVVIENSKVIAISSGSTFVQATYKNATSNVEVKVMGNSITSEVPTGLTYDAQSGYIKWNPVIVKLDNRIIQANSYTVSIKQGETVTEEKVIGDTKFELAQAGDLEIKVKCNDYISSDKVVYKGSAYSEALVVKKLSAPYDLQYNDQTNTLTWKADGVNSFRVKVNGVIGDVINEKQAVIDLTSSSTTIQQKYEVSVLSVDNSAQNQIVVVSESEKKTYTRLFAPTMSINNGIITWDNSQLGKFHYELTIKNLNSEESVISLTNGEYDCKGLDAGEYNLKLKAVSEDELTLDSVNTVELKNVTKLEKVTLLFDPVARKLSASNTSGKLIKLILEHQDERQEIVLQNGEYNWNFETVGTYFVTAISYAQNAKEMNSDVSNMLTIVQLPKIELSKITQRAEDGKYFVTFEEQEGVNYSISVEGNGLTKQTDGSLGRVDEIFSQAKKYEVEILSSKASPDATTFILPSTTVIEVYRQQDLRLSLETSQNKPKAVSWRVIATSGGYTYYLTKDGQDFVSDQTQNNKISVLGYEYGRYSFYAKALGRTVSSILYLESLEYAQIDFEVQYVLDTPQVDFDTETKILTVEKVDMAQDYVITFDGQSLVFDSTQESIQIDLNSKIAQEKSYEVTVRAVNNEDDLILDSDVGSITITKLSAPKRFNVSDQGVVVILDYPSSRMLDTKKELILINDVETTTLGDEDEYVVVAKFNANKSRVGNAYYIDSEQSTFSVQRLAKPNTIELDETVLYWEENTNDNFVYLLNILQNTKEYTLNPQQNELDVFDNSMSFVDLSQDFDINVQFVFTGALINLEEQDLVYYTSPASDFVTIHKIKSDIDVVISEENGVTTIEWQNSEVEDVTYTLYFDGEEIYKGDSTSFDITDLCEQTGEYVFRLKITKQGYIASEYVEAYVERLSLPESITVDEQENIWVETIYSEDELEKVLITCQGDEITSLSEFVGDFEISLKLIAKVYTSGYHYYLDSFVDTYQFSRLSALSQPQIEANILTYDEIAEVESYQIKFSDGQDFYTMQTPDTEVYMLNPNVLAMLDSLNSNTISISVQARIYEFDALPNQVYNLSSLYSPELQITRLGQVSNIVLQNSDDQDYTQSDVEISWDFDDTDLVINRYVIEVYRNNRLLDTLYSNTTSIVTDCMAESGKYFVSIYVEGKQSFINSYKADSYEVTRFSAVTNLKVKSDGTLTFAGVNKAEEYVVVYSNGAGVQGELTTTQTSIVIEDLTQQVYSGDVDIYVYAIGDGGTGENKTLSSPQSNVLTANRSASDNVVLYVDKLVAGTGEDIGRDYTYLIEITQDDRLVKSLQLRYGEEYEYEDFKYSDDHKNVDKTVEKEFVVTVQIKSSKQNTIISNVATRTFTKLPVVQNLGFKRETDSLLDNIWFYADKVEHASKYSISIGDNELGDVVTTENNIKIALTSEVYENFIESWRMTVYAVGLIDEEGTSYINSSTSTISGKRLANVENFKVESGKLAWSKVNRATDYAIRVSDLEVLTGYVNDGVHTLTEELQGKSGDFTLNIKAVGNIGTELVTNNILLDSLFNEEDYLCSKLAMVSNLTVKLGFISFKQLLDEDVEYYGVVGSNEFLFELVESEQEEYISVYSQDMYDELAYSTVYQVGIKVKSNQEDVLDSDICEKIKFKIMENTSRGSLRVQLKVASQNPLKYDYETSLLVWDEDFNAINGYNLRFDDELLIGINNTNYVLDSEGLLGAGTYTVQLALAGSSAPGNGNVYTLSSHYGEILSYTKLDTPTLSIFNGRLNWSKISNAYGYMVYLDGRLVSNATTPINTTYMDLDIATSTNKDYSTFEVVAVPMNLTNFIASNRGLYTDEEDIAKTVTKLKAPTSLSVEDGILKWDEVAIGVWDMIALSQGETITAPITASLNTLMSAKDKIQVLLFSNTGSRYTYELNAEKLIYLSDSTKERILTYGTSYGLTEEMLDRIFGIGWPSINNGYLDIGGDVEPGTYNLQIKQIGDNDRYLTSNYGTSQEVYIPYAPKLSLIYTQNSFRLSWNAITIPNSYNAGTVKYVVFGEHYVENEYGYQVSERVILTDEAGTSNLYLNLSELIQNGVVDSSYYRFGVYVHGTNSKVLNGKISNFIVTSVLDRTNAYVHDGVLYWNGQTGASEYLISYTEYNNPDSTRYVTVTGTSWDGSQLDSNILSYDIEIQAIGNKQSSTTEGILTGPSCSVGKLSKLKIPVAQVRDGVIGWQDFENTTSYAVYIYEQNDFVTSREVQKYPDDNGFIWFENDVNSLNYSFRFKSMGDRDIVLSETTTACLNSEIGNAITGTTVDTIQNVAAVGGKLLWDIATNNSVQITYYKLIFNKIDENNNLMDSEIIVTGNSFIESMESCAYSCDNLDAGRYQVTIQGYFNTEDSMGKYIYDGDTAYYLISVKSRPYVFEKYHAIKGIDQSGLLDNITIQDGEFYWIYTDIDSEDPHNYNYELKFITSGGTRTIIQEQNYFSGYILNEYIPSQPFELEIRVIAKNDTVGYINSDYLKFANLYHDNSSMIYQLNSILDTDIVLDYVGESPDLHIIWDSYYPATGSSLVAINVEYLVTYWTSLDETRNTLITNLSNVSTSIFQSTISEEHTLYYTIQVLPLGDNNFVASKPSTTKEIQKPSTVREVIFNPTKQYFTWAMDGTSNDHLFKVKDEILQLDADMNVVLNENNQPVVLRTYIFITNSNQDNIYYPVEMGAHRVGVAIILKNSKIEGNYAYYYTYEEEQDVGSAVTIDLFNLKATSPTIYGGSGTISNPYIITSGEQFANMSYRLNKPSWQNSYTLSINGEETRHTLTGKDTQFCFKQTQDIVASPLALGTNDEFNGSYDGAYNSITWNFDLSKIPTSGDLKQYVALFNVVSSQAVIQNLRVYANFTNTLTRGGTIALVTYENKGTIKNIILGSQSQEISITSDYTVSLYGVAQNNSGIIQGVVNYYNVSLQNNTSVSGAIRVSYGGICGTNNGTVSQVANYGNIMIKSTIATVGGVVAINSGTLTQAVLKNTSSTLSIAKEKTGTVQFYFGGLVATNSGSISYSYVYTNIVVSRNAQAIMQNRVYIAGLVGESSNSNITSCYVKNIITKSQTEEIGSIYVFIANLTTASYGSGTACFYNAGQAQDPVGGSASGNFTAIESYAQIPSGTALNNGESYFTTAQESSFPTLRWESEFIRLW